MAFRTPSARLPSRCQALANNRAQPDAGTSSFFINLNDNSFLDLDFTVFAKVSDLTVINNIMDLTTKDFKDEPLFGSNPNDTASFTTVPIQADGKQVFIKRAFVVTDALSAASAVAAAGLTSSLSQSASNLTADGGFSPAASAGLSASPGLTPNNVPEPTSLGLIAVALLTLATSVRRRSRH